MRTTPSLHLAPSINVVISSLHLFRNLKAAPCIKNYSLADFYLELHIRLAANAASLDLGSTWSLLRRETAHLFKSPPKFLKQKHHILPCFLVSQSQYDFMSIPDKLLKRNGFDLL